MNTELSDIQPITADRIALCVNACEGISNDLLALAGGAFNVFEEKQDIVSDLSEALEGVLRVADRKTVEFDAARAALDKAKGFNLKSES